jgi:O-antigen biosynthesis protein
VPCYNYGRFLPDCLRSIFSLEGGSDIEIIAIDDCSTDNTGEVLRQFNDARLRIITHEKNRGHIFTVNEGLKEARGEFLVRMDPDDRYRPNFLTATLPKFAQHPEVGLVYGDVALIDAEGRLNAERCDTSHGGRDFKGNEFIALLKKNFICAPTVVARRETWMSAWPVPEGLAFNDWYFNIMLARRYEFYFVNEVVAEYRVHGANHHTKVAKDRTEEESILKLLDCVFSETENNPALEIAKRRARGEIYAAQYLDFANKYFGFGMNADARRCYWQAIRSTPILLFRSDVFRRLSVTFIKRSWYDSAKRLLAGSPRTCDLKP